MHFKMKLFKEYKSSVYTLAMLAALPPIFLISWHEAAVGISYFIAGAVFCYFWPREGWKWGIYLGIPVFALMAFSFLFAGLGGAPLYDLFMMFLPGLVAAAGALICQLVLRPGEARN